MNIPNPEDKELYAEFENAYKIASPYRAKLQYRLSIIQGCDFNPTYDDGMILYHPLADNKHEILICAGSYFWLHSIPKLDIYIDPLLLGE